MNKYQKALDDISNIVLDGSADGYWDPKTVGHFYFNDIEILQEIINKNYNQRAKELHEQLHYAYFYGSYNDLENVLLKIFHDFEIGDDDGMSDYTNKETPIKPEKIFIPIDLLSIEENEAPAYQQFVGYSCGNCDSMISIVFNKNHCGNCGCKIDWSDQ